MRQQSEKVVLKRAFVGALLLFAAPLTVSATVGQETVLVADAGDPSASFDAMGAMAFDLATEARERMDMTHASANCDEAKNKVSLRLADLRQLVARTLRRVDDLNSIEDINVIERREQALVAELRAVGATNVLISRVDDLQNSYGKAQLARENAVSKAKRRIQILRQELMAARDIAVRREDQSVTEVAEEPND